MKVNKEGERKNERCHKWQSGCGQEQIIPGRNSRLRAHFSGLSGSHLQSCNSEILLDISN